MDNEKIKKVFNELNEKLEEVRKQSANKDLIMYFSKFFLRHGDNYAKAAVSFKKNCDDLNEELPGDQIWEDGKYYQGTEAEKAALKKWHKTIGEAKELADILSREISKN